MLISNLHIKFFQKVIILRHNYKTMFHTCVENFTSFNWTLIKNMHPVRV